MGLMIGEMKEFIKDADDTLEVQVVGRYVGEENMIMTDFGLDEEGLWFELGYPCDCAGYLE